MGEEYNINDITSASGYSFITSDNYFRNGSLLAYNNDMRTINVSEMDEKITSLESDIKDLKKNYSKFKYCIIHLFR